MNATSQTVIGASIGAVGLAVCAYAMYIVLFKSEGPSLSTAEEYISASSEGGKRRRKTRRNMHRLKLSKKQTKSIRSSH